MPSPPLPNPSPKLVCLPLLLALAVAATLFYAARLHATLASGRTDLRPAPHPDPDPAMAAAIRDGQTTLALRLVKHLAPAASSNTTKGNGNGNVVFSPVSIHAALALLASGARGATLGQLLAFLGAPSATDLADFGRRVVHGVLGDRAGFGGPHVLFSGGIWVEASRGALKTAFRDVAVESYKSEARTVRFANQPKEVAEAINSWAKKATNNLIDSIISADDITDETVLVLANAVYLKAKWSIPFETRLTRPGTFHRLDGSRVNAQFMSQTMHGVQYASSEDGFKVLKLPYKHGRDNAAGVAFPDADDTRYSMYLFLPDERYGIAKMVDAITAGPDYLYNVLPKTEAESVTVRLPKFEISFERELGPDLPQLGLSLQSADLGGIFKEDRVGRPMSLSKFLHKAVVKVNEDETEAAAVTMVIFSTTAWQPPPVEFVADHPFTFFIMEERSGVIVFAGHVLDPTN